MKKISIVIPVYNEKGTLLEILEKVGKSDTLGLEKEIILVDDGSTDGTRDILKTLEKKYLVIYHEKNKGKGAALRTGFGRASGDITMIQDADLEYSPDNYPQLIRPVLDGKEKIVYGSRVMKSNPKSYWKYYLGAKFLNETINLFFGSHLTDFLTCYKIFLTPILKELDLKSDRFEIEGEMTIKAIKKGYNILEVPIDYYPRKLEQGKKIKPKDGLIILRQFIKYKFGL